MAEGKCTPSLFPNPENEALENTTSKNRLVPKPAPSHPSFGREISTPCHDAENDMTQCIFKSIEFNTSMKFLIEIPLGNDIPETLINIARQYNANISVLSGSGPVSNITLLNSVSHAPYLPIRGPLEMFSLSGTHFITNPTLSSFSIFLSGVPGHVFGGIIGGNVMAAGRVIVTAILFEDPDYQRMVSISEKTENVKEDDNDSIAAVMINVNHASADPKNGNNN